MKKNELKKVLKPLIKECIKEVIFEEGVLSGIISEVVKGVDTAPVVREQKVKPDNSQFKKKLQEKRKRMLDAIGRDSFNGVDIFEGVKPPVESSPHSPLSNISPGDAGVDISQLFNSNWSKLI